MLISATRLFTVPVAFTNPTPQVALALDFAYVKSSVSATKGVPTLVTEPPRKNSPQCRFTVIHTYHLAYFETPLPVQLFMDTPKPSWIDIANGALVLFGWLLLCAGLARILLKQP